MARRDQLAKIGEFGFLHRLLPTLKQRRGVIVGPGDDCAVVRGRPCLLFTVDALVEGAHFEPGWLSPVDLGFKSIAVNLSDIAAMGGRPLYAVLNVAVPPTWRAKDLAAFHRGAAAAMEAAGASIVGGNLSSAAVASFTVAVVGAAPPRPVLRRGAKPGDLIYVTGTLGDAAAGLQILRARVPRRGSAAKLVRRFARPQVRLEAGRLLAEREVASAMIDVSDGLVQDLGHICAASRVGAVIVQGILPRSAAYRAVIGDAAELALTGGEDYELLFTVSPRCVPRLDRLRARIGCEVTCIGEIVGSPRGVRVQDRGGRLDRPEHGGHEHFAVASSRLRAGGR